MVPSLVLNTRKKHLHSKWWIHMHRKSQHLGSVCWIGISLPQFSRECTHKDWHIMMHGAPCSIQWTLCIGFLLVSLKSVLEFIGNVVFANSTLLPRPRFQTQAACLSFSQLTQSVFNRVINSQHVPHFLLVKASYSQEMWVIGTVYWPTRMMRVSGFQFYSSFKNTLSRPAGVTSLLSSL